MSVKEETQYLATIRGGKVMMQELQPATTSFPITNLNPNPQFELYSGKRNYLGREFFVERKSGKNTIETIITGDIYWGFYKKNNDMIGDDTFEVCSSTSDNSKLYEEMREVQPYINNKRKFHGEAVDLSNWHHGNEELQELMSTKYFKVLVPSKLKVVENPSTKSKTFYITDQKGKYLPLPNVCKDNNLICTGEMSLLDYKEVVTPKALLSAIELNITNLDWAGGLNTLSVEIVQVGGEDKLRATKINGKEIK